MGFSSFFCCYKKPQQDLSKTYADASKYFLEYFKQTRLKIYLDNPNIEKALEKFLNDTAHAEQFSTTNNTQLVYRRATAERALAILKALNPKNQEIIKNSSIQIGSHKSGRTSPTKQQTQELSNIITPENAKILQINMAEGYAEGYMQKTNIFRTSRAENVYKHIAKSLENMTDENCSILQETKKNVEETLQKNITNTNTKLNSLENNRTTNITTIVNNNGYSNINDVFSASGSTGKSARKQLNETSKEFETPIVIAKKLKAIYEKAQKSASSLLGKLWAKDYAPVVSSDHHVSNNKLYK